MKYRQWKKNYKKKHGVNPPLELDKRKKRRLARKMARQINKTLPTAAETLAAAINSWVKSIKPVLATFCESVAAAFSNVAAGLREESEAVENDEYITGHNSAGIAGDIFKTGQTGREGAERMNNVSLTGRLTREPELRYGGQDNSTAITRFTLAVDDGKDTDFINIKCFGRTAEWAQKWLSKGSRAEVTGKIKTGSYESQRTGSKVYYTEVVANSVGFGESKAEAEARGQQLPESDGFMNIPEGADEELPFN